jgi:hypothetical protein
MFPLQLTLMNAMEVPDRTGEKTQWQELSVGSEQPATRILPIGLPASHKLQAVGTKALVVLGPFSSFLSIEICAHLGPNDGPITLFLYFHVTKWI